MIVLLLFLQSEQPVSALLRAEEALAQRAYGEAREGFVQARTVALAIGDKQATWRAAFYLGLTSELLAETAPDNASLWADAATYYEEAERLHGTSSVWNNLAGVRARQGRHVEAQALYQKAIDADDDYRPFYEQNYAKYLRSVGKDREALEYYRRAARVQILTEDVHDEVVTLALRASPGELVGYLNDILGLGASGRVISAALRGLHDLSARSAHDKLTEVIGRALSLTPFAGVPASVLASLRTTRHAGAIELATLYESKPVANHFEWWRRGDPAALEVFRALVRSIGRDFERRKRPEAERYYQLAVEVGAVPEAQSVIDLSSYYATTGRKEDLERISQQYEDRISLTEAVLYHSTLGAIHAKRGSWVNAAKPSAGALHQLERAEAVRKELNALSPTALIPADGGLLTLLADGYLATRQTTRANKVRQEAADAFSLAGDQEAAREALASMASDPGTIKDDEVRQELLVATSPRSTVMQTVGITDITISYGRPAVKGRMIWGSLVPYGKVWRTGANDKTIITFSDDVWVNGQKLSKGEYSMSAIPGAYEWALLFERSGDSWGHRYSTPDSIRIMVKPQPSEFHEWMTFEIPEFTTDVATVVLRWENLSVPFTIDTKSTERTIAQLRDAMKPDWRTPYVAASFAFENRGVASDAEIGGWLEQSLSINQNVANLWLKARVAQRAGNSAEALRYAELALQVATPEQADFANAIRQQVSFWRR